MITHHFYHLVFTDLCIEQRIQDQAYMQEPKKILEKERIWVMVMHSGRVFCVGSSIPNISAEKVTPNRTHTWHILFTESYNLYIKEWGVTLMWLDWSRVKRW
jgi:hypothetical protein